MYFLKIASVFVCLLTLSGYPSSAFAYSHTTTYKQITENIRLATTYEDGNKTRVVGERLEMEDPILGWFEAEKTANGTFEFTVNGLADKQTAEDDAADGGGC